MLIQPAVDAPESEDGCSERLTPPLSGGHPPAPGGDIAVEHHQRRIARRAQILVLALVAMLAGGGAWWHRAVTADPGLSFDGGPNVFRNAEGGDLTGIERVENSFGTDVNVAYQPGAPLHGLFGLYNRGHRTVTIEAVPPRGFYYWAFDGPALSKDWRTAMAGRDYGPFHPFRLRPGETHYLRLDFHTATCDPAGLQSGSSRIVSLPLRYKVLGVTRTITVPFNEVSIGLMTVGACDHPLTDRP